MQGRLDRRIQLLRLTAIDDGHAVSANWSQDPADDYFGDPIWAARADVSDAERFRAAELAATLSARFTVRYSSFTASISAKDRILCDGVLYDIVGIKERGGRRRFFEISAWARTDQ